MITRLVGARACDCEGGQDSAAYILCIDENTMCWDRLRKCYCNFSGYSTLTALSGNQGLRLLLQNSVDLVVVDYEMPGMNGDLVAQAIRRSRPHIPIILFTGIPDDIPDCVRQNLNGVVSKTDFGGLLTLISKLTGKSLVKREAT